MTDLLTDTVAIREQTRQERLLAFSEVEIRWLALIGLDAVRCRAHPNDGFKSRKPSMQNMHDAIDRLPRTLVTRIERMRS